MLRFRPLVTAFAVASCVASFVAEPASANSWSVFGFDGHSMARGNALTGGAKGAQAVYYNPAGLIREKKRDISLSFYHGEPLLKYEVDPTDDLLDLSGFATFTTAEINARCGNDQSCIDDYDRYNDYVRGGQTVSEAYERLRARAVRRAKNAHRVDNVNLSGALPLAINPENAWAAAGVGVSLPIGPITYQRLKGPTTPFFLRYDDTPQNLSAIVGAGIEPIDWLRLGIGVMLFADLSINLNAHLLLPPELFIEPLELSANFQDIQLYLDGEATMPLSISPTAGIQISPAPWVDIGIAFREQQRADIKADSTIAVETPLGVNAIPVEVLAGAIFTPREVAAGFSFYPLAGMAIMADVTWQQWSRYIPPFAIEANIAGVGGAACDLIGSVQNLDPLLRDVVGSLGSLAESLPFDLNSDGICDFVEDIIPSNINIATFDRNDPDNVYNDTIVIGFGFEYGKDDWQIATGYRYEPTPIPAQTGIFNVLGADTHSLGAGFNYKVLSFASIGLFSQYRMLKSTYTRKSDARIDDELAADAYPDIEDANFGNGDETLAALQELVDGKQVVTPGYPGYTVGGSFLSVGLQANIWF